MTTREFGKMYHISIQAINKKVLKATSNHKNIIQIDKQFFTYTNGIGRGGKVLQIWSEPFKSEAEAEAFLHNYRVDMLEKVAKHTCGVNNEITTNATHTLHALNDMSSGAVVSGGVNDTLACSGVGSSILTNNNNIPSKAIESNIASIHTEATATMGGVVDSHNSLCGDLHVCDDGGDDACDLLHNQKETDSIRDVTLSLNMTNNSDLTSKKDNMTSGGQCK